MGRAGDIDRQQIRVSPDSVLDVDDDVPGRERRGLHDVVLGAPGALGRPGQAFTQNVLLGDDGERIGLENRAQGPVSRVRCRTERDLRASDQLSMFTQP